MTWFRNTYNTVFFGFLFSVILIFFYIRPLNSPWDRFINGDGLGYYSYLPAKYIYNDTHYEFKWFNTIFNQHYAQSSFPNPEDNFLVNNGTRRINKYYPGLSFIWLPFFATAHLYARSFNYPADGFSEPYQWAIGLASIFYLLIGLIYLRRLVQKLFHNPFVSLIVPIAIFYGTPLFSYSIRYNSLSHLYSFTFLILFINALVSYFNEKDKRLNNLLFCLLWLVITTCIRPFTGLIILVIPAFFPDGFFKERLRFEKIKPLNLLTLIVLILALFYQFGITYTQSGSLMPYTYTGERFHFNKLMFFEALIGYRIGLLVYVPLFFVSLFGIPWLSSRRRIILPLFFFSILFLYSCWWYWPIVKRTMIDFYFIPAIFLGALLNRFHTLRVKIMVVVIIGLTLVYYQFKNFQINNGVLDEFNTYKEVFWRNFFRVNKAKMFLVPPPSILKQGRVNQNFESLNSVTNRTQKLKYSGSYSLLLDTKNYISTIMESSVPAFFLDTGVKKIRVSLWLYVRGDVSKMHVFIKGLAKDGTNIFESPFYLNEDDLYKDTWDYKEFGMDLSDISPQIKAADKIVITVWNVESKGEIYVDEAQVDFMLTDPGFEITK